jgi:hypothetical protein
MNYAQFKHFINSDNKFLEYNRNSLFIIRNGNFLDIKNLFGFVSEYRVNIGRGSSQKAHILSPLDFRLSSYMMAMFTGNYHLISYLNAFNDLSKDRYLSYTNLYSKSYKQIIFNKSLHCQFRPIILDKLPLYCQNNNLGEYFLECRDTTCSFDVYNYLQ